MGNPRGLAAMSATLSTLQGGLDRRVIGVCGIVASLVVPRLVPLVVVN